MGLHHGNLHQSPVARRTVTYFTPRAHMGTGNGRIYRFKRKKKKEKKEVATWSKWNVAQTANEVEWTWKIESIEEEMLGNGRNRNGSILTYFRLQRKKNKLLTALRIR